MIEAMTALEDRRFYTVHAAMFIAVIALWAWWNLPGVLK